MPQDEHFQVHTGERFYARRWPVRCPRGGVVLVHGFGEHCGRYDGLAAYLNGLGLSVYSYDQRGHGRSPGKRGHIRRFALLVQDLRAFLQYLQPETKGVPIAVLGHSMGGLVLAHLSVQQPAEVAGLVFSSPLLQLQDVSPLLVRMSRLLSILSPRLPVARVEPDALSRDLTVVSSYRSDPFVYHGRINARTGAELYGAVQWVRQRFANITSPLYILHGTADRLAHPQGSRDFLAKAGAVEKRLRLYEGGYHELFNDSGRDLVLDELGKWLLARMEMCSGNDIPLANNA